MKLLSGKHLLILVLSSIVVSFVAIGIRGNAGSMDIAVYLGELVGTTVGIIAISAIFALVISGLYWLISRKPMQLVFTFSMYLGWVFIAISLFVRDSP